jgi:hypothetical protein
MQVKELECATFSAYQVSPKLLEKSHLRVIVKLEFFSLISKTAIHHLL